VLRDDFGPESDIDFMTVIRNDDYGPWMSRVEQMEKALSELVGREVDVVMKESVQHSENWIRKGHIFETAQVIYGP
jgi:predicted nucleotidyltransferase